MCQCENLDSNTKTEAGVCNALEHFQKYLLMSELELNNLLLSFFQCFILCSLPMMKCGFPSFLPSFFPSLPLQEYFL